MLASDDSLSLILFGCKVNPSSTFSGTCTISTSLTCALTAYMPYVGGHVSILSLPGTQKHRSRASIASSDPTPQHKFSGLSAFLVWTHVFRSLQKPSFNSDWWGSGYRLSPRKSSSGSAGNLFTPLDSFPSCARARLGP